MNNTTTQNSAGNSAWARFMLFLHWLVRVDPEILSGCPMIDRFQMVSKAVLLATVAGIALFAWGAFFLMFWPFYVALPLTVLVVVWIVMIDQFMGRRIGPCRGFWPLLAARRVVSASMAWLCCGSRLPA